jgi:TonB family protein
MTRAAEQITFKKAVTFSLIAHLAVFILIIISPKLPTSSKREMIYYIPLNLVAPGGESGGRGGDGRPAGAKPPAAPAKRETLRDLTTPQKAKPEPKSSLRHPVEKPKKESQIKTQKKAVITKQEPSSPESTKKEETGGSAAEAGGEGTGMGTGLRIGGGGPGGGFGPGYGPGTGLSNFPYTYYLNIITERVSANWFTSLVDPGVPGNFQTIIFFRIQKNGQVTDLGIEQSSGLTPLDLSALRAVRVSAPFPPLPRDYDDTYLAIHLIFEHAK